ncbi:MAG: DUF1015 domain-containing protein [Acidimicrobiia bacterium]|nr:DUF1015 domain-containing protein [Acidimicrobiia bacterium]
MIRPLDGYVVSPDVADRVVAPVAESLHHAARDHILATNPDTSLFLLTEDAEARSHAREYLDRVTIDGTFTPTTGWWIYRITDESHQQTGIVAEVAVAAYESDRIRRHEHTVAEVAGHVADALDEVGGSTHPVSLIYRHDPHIHEIVTQAVAGEPVLRLVREGRIQETWKVDGDPGLGAALDAIPALYIADGHHRSAGAAVLSRRNATGPADSRSHFLAALFPDTDMRTLSYHRCLHLPDHSPAEILAAIARHFPMKLLSEPDGVPEPGETWLFTEGTWYTLRLPHGTEEGPTSALEASRLQHQILGPICDVADPRADPRLNYVPGNLPLDVLAGTCREQAGLGFVTRPPSVDDVIAVSDAGGIMPPKSTWFTPKIGAGIFLRRL